MLRLTNQQLAAKGQLHVGQTGLFKKKYLTWKSQPTAYKTWNDFKTHWNRELKDFDLLNCISSKEAGFGAHTVVTQQEQVYSNLEEAMDNLAYAATTSNNVAEDLVKNNTKLTKQEENTKLLKIIKISIAGGHTNDTLLPTNPKNCRGHKKIDYEATYALMEPKGYCWLCRYRGPKNLHQAEAGTPAGSHMGQHNGR
eukprot:8861863-Ditylum_brightwellii.AAC.1